MFEKNAFIKDWRSIDISFGLIYPNIYSLGMSSYSIRLLYYLINQYKNILCERIFLPEKIRFPANKDYKNEIRSIENQVVPSQFDILGFSVQFENDFRHILWILEKSNIPLQAKIRQDLRKTEGKSFPLIIGGGPVATSNPLPLSKIFDLFFIGDAEPNLDEFLSIFLNYKNTDKEFDSLLYELSKLNGIFIPSLKNHVNRLVLKDLNKFPIPDYQLRVNTKKKSVFEENFFIEVNRGCPFRCKFCISSFHNHPFRNRNYENIIDTLKNAIKVDDFSSVGLIGSCVSAHPQFLDICKNIIKYGKRLMIPSIRIEHLNNETIKVLENAGIKTITIAPETGSEDLRFKLNKKISNEQIYKLVEKINNSKINNVKMYFLIGLPDEKEEDIHEIVNLIKNIDNLNFQKKALRISVNPVIPKLNTPYEKNLNHY
ncbi:MAG: radical SAM protein, partial [Candidatus Lokiarchaeota archaeon]